MSNLSVSFFPSLVNGLLFSHAERAFKLPCVCEHMCVFMCVCDNIVTKSCFYVHVCHSRKLLKTPGYNVVLFISHTFPHSFHSIVHSFVHLYHSFSHLYHAFKTFIHLFSYSLSARHTFWPYFFFFYPITTR